MAAPSSSTSPPSLLLSNSSVSYSNRDLIKEVKSHEIALAELSNLSSSRTVYQRNGSIFFRTKVQKAVAFEQKQLDAAKAKLQKARSS